MPSGSSKNKKGGGTDLTSTTEVCALCCDTLKKGQDVLKCEGSCGCNVHRYCAGVTKLYFDELVKGSIPFVCQYCALNVYKAIVQQLQDEVASLKLELAETKSLCERRSQTHPPASYASVASKEPLSKQPAKHGGQKGQKGQRPPAKQPTTASTGATQPPSRRTAGESRSVNNGVSGPRVRVDGARRVWGTMSHTTSKSVENVITRCCNLTGLKIRRKIRTADTGKISWWFVVHADEAVLCELDSKWESVNLQTSWQLQSCSKPAIVNDAETHAGGTSSLLDENPSGNTSINEISIEATTIPNATSTTVPIPCNPTVPNPAITTDQPQPTASFLGVTQEVATPPSQ